MTSHITKSSDKVGYGKPPRHTQTQKGRAGDPRGRPARDSLRRLNALTLREAYRTVPVNENGITVPVPALQAILRSQAELAANGNVQAQRAILKAVERIEREDREAQRVAEICRSFGWPDIDCGVREHEPDDEEPGLAETQR
jgi:hypothetical protein